jgi:hypothetical protein
VNFNIFHYIHDEKLGSILSSPIYPWSSQRKDYFFMAPSFYAGEVHLLMGIMGEGKSPSFWIIDPYYQDRKMLTMDTNIPLRFS